MENKISISGAEGAASVWDTESGQQSFPIRNKKGETTSWQQIDNKLTTNLPKVDNKLTTN